MKRVMVVHQTLFSVPLARIKKKGLARETKKQC